MQQAIEPARQAKMLAKSLEGSVTLDVRDDQHAALEAKRGELEEFFIISELRLAVGAEPKASVVRSSHKGCARCWRFLPDVEESGLCERCAGVIAK